MILHKSIPTGKSWWILWFHIPFSVFCFPIKFPILNLRQNYPKIKVNKLNPKAMDVEVFQLRNDWTFILPSLPQGIICQGTFELNITRSLHRLTRKGRKEGSMTLLKYSIFVVAKFKAIFVFWSIHKLKSNTNFLFPKRISCLQKHVFVIFFSFFFSKLLCHPDSFIRSALVCRLLYIHLHGKCHRFFRSIVSITFFPAARTYPFDCVLTSQSQKNSNNSKDRHKWTIIFAIHL